MSQQSAALEPDGLPVRESGEWVKRKHHFLRRYCDMFTTSMKGRWELTYLDLLAGPGRCKIIKTTELVHGSPFVALDFPFDRYVFYEEDGDLAAALKARVAKCPKAERCSIINSDWAKEVARDSFTAPRGLTLAFIDPTGISQVPWLGIQNLVRATQRIDVLMTIQHGMGINLNVHQYRDKERSALDEFVGGSTWRESLTKQDTSDYLNTALRAFSDKMADEGFGTRKWVLVRNDSKAPLYYLCLFSRHPRGMDFWDKVVLNDEHGQRAMEL